jgi:prepilin-type N-terminal cleavage/methylation domain-containing protein
MRKEHGFSLIELLIVVAIIGIVSAIAIPGLLNARKAAYEANAVRYLKTWVAGEEMYSKVHGFYSSTDEDLVKEGFINKALNSAGDADDTAFTYSIDSSSTNPDGTPNTTVWFGRARRKSPLVAKRSFYIDQTGVIRFAVGGTANLGDPPLD